LAAVLLALLGYRLMARLTAPRGAVVTAAVALPKGAVLTPAQLTMAAVRRGLPAGALQSPTQVQGRMLTVGKQAGEPILRADLAEPPPPPSLSAMIPEGRVLTTLTIRHLSIPLTDLRRGDRVDVLTAGVTEKGQRVSRLVVRDAYVLGHALPAREGDEPQDKGKKRLGIDVRPPAGPLASENKGQVLLLAVQPADVVSIAEVDGSNAHLSLVVHSRDSVKSGRLLSVGPVASGGIELISGTTRQRFSIP
jgi:Flp pilus assembly protein CpaB